MRKATILSLFSLHLTFVSTQTFDYNEFIPIEGDFETPSLQLMPALPEFELDLDFSKNFKFENFKLEPKTLQLTGFNNTIFNLAPQDSRSWFTLSSDNVVYPSLGDINMVSGAYNFKLNDYVALSAGMYAGKYFINDHLTNDVGINGNVKFMLSERFDLNLSGRYSFNNMQTVYGSSMFPQTGFGTSVEYKINDVFGILIGVYYEYDEIQGKYVLRPYIVPVFYKSLFELLGLKKKKRIPIIGEEDYY
jgi:hypothetical protein